MIFVSAVPVCMVQMPAGVAGAELDAPEQVGALSYHQVKMSCKSLGLQITGPYWIFEEIAGILWEEVGAIRMLLWGEEELLHSEHWSMDQRKSMAIALRDWAITALWSIWICAVDERLACGARAVRFTGLLERFIFYDRDSKASNAQSSRLLGGLTKALRKLVEGEIPYVNPLLQGYFDRFLQMQDNAAFRKAKLIQHVMRLRWSHEKQQVLHTLSDWSTRVLLMRRRIDFLSNEFDLVKEALQHSMPKAAVGRIWNHLKPNVFRYLSNLKELTARKQDATDASTASSSAEDATQAPGGSPAAPPARRWADFTDSEDDLW
ncbi:unnamed protein product [Durusdinium trenchii]|uniref:Uncharacterized protein n=1 Tax=Durusdinium trenchii TaxID=1381693 RepID=A0ABP0MBW4_9DINO